MEQVIYSGSGGLGIISKNENEADFIEAKAVSLADKIIEPGSMTDLFGKFTKPIRYAGLLKENEHEVMCFHTGDIEDIFGKTSYYYCWYKISEYRIFNKYTELSGRDFNWINNQWK